MLISDYIKPVMLTDSTGYAPEWLHGASRILTGVLAIAAGVAVIASGVALAPMLIIAVITIAAGGLTVLNGTADIQQSITGDNFIRDSVFNGNQSSYNTYAGMTEGVAIGGSIVCGGWLKYNQPRIQTYKSLNSYNIKGKHLTSTAGNWSKFNTTDHVYLRNVGQNALRNTPMKNMIYNSADSYKLIYDTGTVIGTSGQTTIRLVFSKVGKIITYFPQ